MADALYSENHFRLPAHSTAQRTPTDLGATGFNSDAAAPEFWDGANWHSMAPATAATLGLSPLIPSIDDPNNTSGIGAPAIIHGTVYAHLAAGVTLGAGQATASQNAWY